MAKFHIPLIAACALAAFSAPSLACGAHPEGHAALTTASTDQAPAAPVAMTPAPKPAAVSKTALKVPGTSAYMGCAKRQQQTVYLTQ